MPFPDRPSDYLRTILANLRNEAAWARDAELRNRIRASRRVGFDKVVDAVAPDDAERMAVLKRIRAAAGPPRSTCGVSQAR